MPALKINLKNTDLDNYSRTNLLFKIVIGGTILAVTLATYYSYQILRKSFLESLKQNAILEVQQGVDKIDKWLATQKAETISIANTPILQTMNWSQVEPYYLSELARLNDFFFFAMVYPDGSYYNTEVGFAENKNIKDRQHIKMAMAGKTYVSDPVPSRTLKEATIVVVSTPVWSENSEAKTPIGVTSGIMSLEQVTNVVNNLKYGNGSYAFALNSEGEAVIYADDRAPDKEKNPAFQPLREKMLAKQSGIELIQMDGQKIYIAYVPITEADWSIALVIPRHNIESQLKPLEVIALVVAGLTMATIGILTQVQAFEQRQLQRSKKAADEANQAKSDFLSNMSHELRTPLNGILGYAQILKRDRNLTPRQTEGLNIIQQSGQHLLTLINDILDLSKIEARKMELYPTDLHLGSFIESVAGIIRMRALEKDVLFKYEAGSNLPNGIHADEKRLRQILLNLLGNAVKFTDAGKVTLRVAVAPEAETANNTEKKTILRFEIADSGVGMTPEQLEKIFEPFEQVGDTKRRAEGTGLGLTITRQLVEMMGGQLQVKSQYGEGSTFWFELPSPVAETARAAKTEVAGKVTGYQGRRRKILVADDKLENRMVLMNMLEPLGFEVELAENGREEVEKAKQMKPDLILTDLVMPSMTGFEAVEVIRETPEIKDTPIIAVSASVIHMDRKKSQIAGCQSFLSKPVEEKELLSVVAEYLQLTWLYEEISPTTETQPTAPDAPVAGDALVIPPPAEMEVLYELAMLGNMKKIRQRCAYLEELDAKYIPFSEKLKEMARGFQEKAIVAFIKEHTN